MRGDCGLKHYSDDSWMTLDKAAKAFGVSRRTLERLRGKGLLPGVRAGRYLKVRIEDVRNALATENPSLILRSILAAPTRTPVREWMSRWSQYFSSFPEDSSLRRPLMSWCEVVAKEHGDLPLAEFHITEARDAARSITLEASNPVFVAMMDGLPPGLPFLSVATELALVFNPHAIAP